MIGESVPSPPQAAFNKFAALWFAALWLGRRTGTIAAPIEVLLDTGYMHAAIGQKLIGQHTDGLAIELAEITGDLDLRIALRAGIPLVTTMTVQAGPVPRLMLKRTGRQNVTRRKT